MPLLHRRDPQVYDSHIQFFAGEEEEEARRGFSEAAAVGTDDTEDVVRLRQKTPEEMRDDDAHYRDWARGRAHHERRTGGGGGAGGDVNAPSNGDAVLMRYWKEDAHLDDGERFLRQYIWNRMWMDEGNSAERSGAEATSTAPEVVPEAADDDADEAELDREEEFERRYNFRFEDPDGATIPQHPRQVEGSMRVDKRAVARAEKRHERKERKDREKLEQQQELVRLRQLQKERIHEQLVRIRDSVGTSKLPVDPQRILEEDFDPATWDTRMRAVFGDEFYSQRDATKPVFEVDPFVDSTQPIGRPDAAAADVSTSTDAATTLQEALGNGSRLVGKHLKKKKKQQQQQQAAADSCVSVAQEHALRQLVDQYYALDFEDVVAGVPCRFKYQEVSPSKGDLRVEDILLCDDHKLRRLMPLYRHPKAVQKTLRHRTLPTRTRKLLRVIAKKGARMVMKKKKTARS